MTLSERASCFALDRSISRETQPLLGRCSVILTCLKKTSAPSWSRCCRITWLAIRTVAELRVLLGMALCVNLDAQAAIEELREAVRLAPDSYIAQLKLGELWMRLRVMDNAEEHTRLAAVAGAKLSPQSELARRQAATIRTMKRQGIERGGLQAATACHACAPSAVDAPCESHLGGARHWLIMQPSLQLALLVAILLPACKIAASLCTRFGIPAILGELMVGVVLGPGAADLLHLRLFAGGEASGALMLLAQVGAMVLMFLAGVETDIERMREASVTGISGCTFRCHLAVPSRGRCWASLRPFLENGVLSGRRPHRDQRLDFCPHTHGRRQNDVARSQRDPRRGGH